MPIWEPLEFGARALALRLAAAKPMEEILEVQRGRLVDLVEHAREHSILYREKFARIDGSSFELSDLPTSSKSEIMEHFDDALTVPDVHRDEVEEFLADESNLGQYFRDKYVLSRTSGSQGQPLLIVQTPENLELLFALQASRGNHQSLNIWQAVKHFLSPARLAAVTLKRGFYPSACAFEYLPEGARSYLEVLQLSLTDKDLIERINEFRPTHLTAYASVLHELARQTEAGRLTLKPELVQLVNISERLMPQAREHYARVFDATVLNDYGMGECLFLTNGCLTSGGMHVNADWAILEVVDAENRPVPAGTKGTRVLITNLANYVQPIIRYEVGDIVTMATQVCGCGSNLPLIAGIDGRDSDMFWIEGSQGVQPFPPAIFEEALQQVSQIREYQLIQENRNRFRILVEPLPGANVDRERARQILDTQLEEYELEVRLQTDLEVVERLMPRDGSKFKRVVSKVPHPEAASQ
jgi:phenylacetate-coenzyme A ligase PaaK-like adenylate-forming protein